MATGRDSIELTDKVKDALYTKINDDMTELFATKTEVENARDGESTLLAQINDLQLYKAEVIAARDGSSSLLNQIDSLQALISALTASGLYAVCTSATRPAFGGISNGVLIYETDTGNRYLADCDNSKWILVDFNKYATGSIPAAGATYSITTGTTIYDTTLTSWKIYNGSAWVLKFNSNDFSVSSGVVSKKLPTVVTVTEASSPYAITAAKMRGNTIFTITGATAAVELDLPTAEAGLEALFHCTVAQYLKVKANTGDYICYDNTLSGSAGYVRTNVQYRYFRLEALNSNLWLITFLSGPLLMDK